MNGRREEGRAGEHQADAKAVKRQIDRSSDRKLRRISVVAMPIVTRVICSELRQIRTASIDPGEKSTASDKHLSETGFAKACA
jgi:hypothetical protein